MKRRKAENLENGVWRVNVLWDDVLMFSVSSNNEMCIPSRLAIYKKILKILFKASNYAERCVGIIKSRESVSSNQLD